VTELTEVERPETGVDGRALTSRGRKTRRRLLESAEQVFAELGYHDASIVKITEGAGVGQGTFYLYFAGKAEIFDELVRDLNAKVRHAMSEGAAKGTTRAEQERLGFRAYFSFVSEHPALYRVMRQAEFVCPDTLHYHYEKIAEGYIDALRTAMKRGEVSKGDPEIMAWALMGMGELLGLRLVLWGDGRGMELDQVEEIGRIIDRVLGPGTEAT
jgi:AcrR family transcriptional regulator